MHDGHPGQENDRTMTNAERYIEAYKQLEHTVRRVYKLPREKSISHYLKEKTAFGKYREQITYCQDVRNFLQHEPKLDDEYPIQPSEPLIDFVVQLTRQISNRPRCKQICVPYAKIYWQSPQSKVSAAMRAMRQRGYVHIPILSNRRVVGVFDGTTVFNYLADHGLTEIDPAITIADIGEYTALDSRSRELFIFVPQNMGADELRQRFDDEFLNGRRISLAFVTANGRKDEAVTGMITPWDLLRADI